MEIKKGEELLWQSVVDTMLPLRGQCLGQETKTPHAKQCGHKRKQKHFKIKKGADSFLKPFHVINKTVIIGDFLVV